MIPWEGTNVNHGVNSLGDFLQLGNAPVNNEPAQMTSSSSPERPDGPASPPPPIGEAAALIARLLAGSEPHVAAREEVPSSIPAPEPAPAVPDPIPMNYPSASLLPSDSGSLVLSPPNAKAPIPFSRTSLSLIIAAGTVLIFGSGLAVGYGVLGQRSKAASKSTLRQGSPPSILNTAPSEALQNQVSASAAANSQPVNPAVSSPYANSSAIAQTRSVALSDIGSDHDLQSPTVQPGNIQSEQPSATHRSPSVLGNNSPSTSSDSGPSAAAAAPPVSIPLSRRPPLESATQSLLTSAQSAHPESASVDSIRAENIVPAASAPDAANTNALPTIISGTTATPVPASSPEVSNQPAASSMGHIDPCQLIHSVQPVYPSEAKRLHVEGDVQLRVVVSVEGIVTSVGLVSGPPLLVPAAIDAARGFRYKPAMLNGKPIETVQTIAMSFDLKN